MRTRIAFVGLCLILMACADRGAPAGGGVGPRATATLELRSTPEKPLGILTWEGQRIRAGLGTRCWAMQCIDFTGPPTPKTYLDVPGDLEIVLSGNGDPESISIGHPPDEEFGPPEDEREVSVRDGTARLDLDPGRYVLVIFARWADQGDAVLTFGLEVAPTT